MHMFFLQLFVNCWIDKVLLPKQDKQSKIKKTLNSNQLYSTYKLTKCCILLRVEEFDNYVFYLGLHRHRNNNSNNNNNYNNYSIHNKEINVQITKLIQFSHVNITAE